MVVSEHHEWLNSDLLPDKQITVRRFIEFQVHGIINKICTYGMK